MRASSFPLGKIFVMAPLVGALKWVAGSVISAERSILQQNQNLWQNQKQLAMQTAKAQHPSPQKHHLGKEYIISKWKSTLLWWGLAMLALHFVLSKRNEDTWMQREEEGTRKGSEATLWSTRLEEAFLLWKSSVWRKWSGRAILMKLFSVVGLDAKVVEDNTFPIFREWMKPKVKQP